MNSVSILAFLLSAFTAHHVVAYAVDQMIDFGKEGESFNTSPLKLAMANLAEGNITVKCPLVAEGRVMTLYPNRHPIDADQFFVYTMRHGYVEEIDIKDILHNNVGSLKAKKGTTVDGNSFLFRLGSGLTVRREFSTFYVMCASERDVTPIKFLQDAIHSYQEIKNGMSVIDAEKGLSEEYANVIAGVVEIKLQGFPSVNQGCGDVDLGIFQDMTVMDPTATVPTCIVDIMEEQRVGFYCKSGKVYPSDCFKSFLTVDQTVTDRMTFDGPVVTNKIGYLYTARFYAEKVYKPFEGYCSCISRNKETNEMVESARIIIRNKMEYNFDLSDMIKKYLLKGKTSSLYHLTLHKGRTLTVKYPLSGDFIRLDGSNEPVSRDGISFADSIGKLANVEINPRDVSRSVNVIIDEVAVPQLLEITEAVVGDALEVDSSKMKEGELKIRYLNGRPLGLKSGRHLYYSWKMTRLGEYGYVDILAQVMITVVPNFDIHQLGCSPRYANIFHGSIGTDVFRRRIWSQKFIDVNHCDAFGTDGHGFGFYCPPGHTAFPDGCQHLLYNANRSKVITDPEKSISVHDPDSGITYITLREKTEKGPSVSCSCVNPEGLEVARLDVHSTPKQMIYMSGSNHKRIAGILFSSFVDMSTMSTPDEETVQEIETIQVNGYGIEKEVTMTIGSRLKLVCQNKMPVTVVTDESLLKQQGYNAGEERVSEATGGSMESQATSLAGDDLRSQARWFPLNFSTFTYKHEKTVNYDMLVAKPYGDVTSDVNLGVNIYPDRNGKTTDPSVLNIEVLENSIIMSKKPFAKFVPLIFVCGNTAPVTDANSSEPVNEHASALRNGNAVANLTEASTSAYDSTRDSHVDGTQKVLQVKDIVKVMLPVTDPYVFGCGITKHHDRIFNDNVLPLADKNGKTIGCIVNLNVDRNDRASFYCPPPYVTDPPDCGLFVPDDQIMEKLRKSKVFVYVRKSRNLYIFAKGHITMEDWSDRGTSVHLFPHECRCLTNTGKVISAIRIYRDKTVLW